MGIVATTTNPSTTNNLGGIAGILVSCAVAYITKYGIFTAIATATGQPELAIAALGAGILGVGAKYLVTHIAELKEADKFVSALQEIKVDPVYPNKESIPVITNNLGPK